jgi:nucleotide-binding universal stress UspA family protein
VVTVAQYRMVVGVDGSDGGRLALRWAVREASSRGGTVQAVTAWRCRDVDPVHTDDPVELHAHAEQVLTDEVAALPPSGVVIAAEVVEGRAAEVLVRAARDADLLVLGGHGHSRVWHTVLGSVSEECVRDAVCPVVVVPAPHPTLVASAEPAIRADG